MSTRVISILSAAAVALSVLLLPAVSADAAAGPAWSLSATAQPTNLNPAPGAVNQFLLIATNVGAATANGEIIVTDKLPGGTVLKEATIQSKDPATPKFTCSAGAGNSVTCKGQGPVHPGYALWANIGVDLTGASGETIANEAEVSGAGAVSVAASTSTTISTEAPPFDFLTGEAGFRAPNLTEEGTAATQAGSHPYSTRVDLNFPTVAPGGFYTSAGHLHQATVDLPPGLLADPSATPTRCTEAELVGEEPGCPPSSQIGTVSIATYIFNVQPESSPLYNMVPPPGTPASFAFNALGVGIFPHILASIRSDSDYGASGISTDVLARGLNPVLGIELELWGDPSSPVHDFIRGQCNFETASSKCPVEPQKTAFLTMPTECNGSPSLTFGHADSWEGLGDFSEATYESADLEGNPVSVSGCNALEFGPTLKLEPSTDLTDSPSGLDVDLHQPQDTELGHDATATLKGATVTLPAGMAVNPSQADGLEACTEEEIGLLPEVQGIHFSKQPPSCPAASRLGTLEVTTPLLAEYGEEGKRRSVDPGSGEAIPRPLHGSIYLAQPIHNPLGSLVAIYLSVEDPRSGTYAKLPGEVKTDPTTGRLTTVFSENPQLPIEDVRLHLFPGARASLITPPTCGTNTTTSDLTPWSTPEGADAHPSDSFQTTATPLGGACPTTEGALPNSPGFSAGTISPQAGAYSPFVLKISREDGSQRLTGIDTTLAPGLLGRLAGIGECADAQIARATSRSNPEEGILERNDPSCPASSQVGTVTVGAGAGPTPIYTSGHAYLAGPYKGAPLSLAVIVPAIAGPFDLGTVVTRVALHIEPETTQIHAVSDPLPTILDGIPLDLRSVALTMDRPRFTLNPTNCDPLQITGTATSSLGKGAALSQRFQVGGCSALPFKPKLSLRLKGKVARTGHPRLIATLKAKEGEADIARAQVKLPPAAFIDQGHIRTVCTRVQWAADACPAGSVYGHAEATSPLLGYPISGPVYLRSSNHKLPDLVAKLQGPASQPIEIDLDGKTDSVKGALRNTFEAVPDAPVSTFRLELFGGRRGLVEMSGGFCKARKADVQLDGQNGKLFDTSPVVGAKCPKAGKGKGHHGRKHGHGGKR
jgi:uncharacterized repeat protein (TIGR01451 family)